MHPRIHGLKWLGEIDYSWEQGCGLTSTNVSENNMLLTAPAGHYKPFKHPHMTRSPPIGVAKLFEVFINDTLFD